MKGHVYILLSQKDHRTYVGSTTDLKRRLDEHNAGKNISTKNRRPFILAYSEEYDNLIVARKRELFLKSRSGRRAIQRLFQENN